MLATVLFRIACLFVSSLNIKLYKTIILHLLYGCETCSVTLKIEHRLRVSENTVLRRIFGPEREEVAGGWRRLDNAALHNMYTSPKYVYGDQINDEMGGICSTNGVGEK
jgi:hypothetical protein